MELFVNDLAEIGLAEERLDDVKALAYRRHVAQREYCPALQHTRSHRRCGAVDDVKDTYDAAAAKRLDINLDDCIIWVGMDVRTESGDVVGYCSDVEFKPRSGIVQAFYVTAGAASSVLVGDTQVPPTMLRGYENGAMVVSDEVKSLGYSGGAAAKAAEASVVVGDKVKKGAKVLDDKGSVAVDKGSRALGKQLGKTRGMFKAFKDEYQKASGGSSKATK